MANLGFVGLGTMGGRIAKRLMDAGHVVTGYNRTKEKARWLIEAGMQWAEPGPCKPLPWGQMESWPVWGRGRFISI